MNKLQHNLIRQFKSRYHLLRRLMILFAVLAVLAGIQSWVHYANLESLLNKAVEQFVYLANEKQNLELTDQITDHFTELRALSAEAVWQSDLNEIQSEFQGFITAPGEGMGAVLGQVTAFNNKASMGKNLSGNYKRIYSGSNPGTTITTATSLSVSHSPGCFTGPHQHCSNGTMHATCWTRCNIIVACI
jgi:hypothetical protein